MVEDTQANKPRKTRSRAGCRTCRIRKVKCDEEYPACRRCVSTGRVCDGYGVWGGGGNFYGERNSSKTSNETSLVNRQPVPMSVLAMSSEEGQYFEWFRCRTVKKIPGAFALPYWNTLLFQASANEPAVLHAILTLSSVHKRDIIGYRANTKNPDGQEQFMLQHYIKAIHHLQPHFSTKDKTSVRIALITCVAFVCLEFLRGRFKTAQRHLQNGLSVLRELQGPSDENYEVLSLNSLEDPNNKWLIDAFSRLHVLVELFTQTYQHPIIELHIARSVPRLKKFRSITDAWRELEPAMVDIFNLTERARQTQIANISSTQDFSTLQKQQQDIHTSLNQWLTKFKASVSMLQIQDPEGIARHLLCEYHIMSVIMASTCLRRGDESIFDTHTSHFLAILNHSIEMWRIRFGQRKVRRIQGSRIDMAHSIVDIGWIPPLYYIAMKCRVHRVRLHAVRMIERGSHREGIWDSKIATCVAREVISIEEGGLFNDVDLDDDFLLNSSLRLQDLLLPDVPDAQRMKEVEVLLGDGSADAVGLRYKRGFNDDYWKEIRIPIS